MSNSLTLDGLELIGTATNPEYRLATGLDTGQIAPDTVTLTSLLLDGNQISGRRTGNRTWQITVLVFSFSDRAELARNVDRLLAAVTADTVRTFTVAWTPDGCPATVFTAFRATATPQKNLVQNDQLIAQVQITFETGPFGESVAEQAITVAAVGGPSPQQVDGMNSGSFTNATLDTTVKYEGAASARVTLSKHSDGHYYTPGNGILRTIAAADLSSFSSMGLRLGVTPPAPQVGAIYGPVALVLTLGSAGGSISGTTTVQTAQQGAWALPTWAIAAMTESGSFDPTQVVWWAVAIASLQTPSVFDPSTTTVWLDDLRAYPPGSIDNTTNEGTLLTVPAVLGSARTPAQVSVSRAGQLTNALIHFPPGDQDPDATIFAGLSSGSVTIPAANMRYDDTFSLVALLTATETAAASRVITATVTQYQNGTAVASRSFSATVVGPQTIVPLTQTDPLTLPLVAVTDENASASLTIAVSSTDLGDLISDVALCSTSGQTVIVTGLPTATRTVYVDRPDPDVGVGAVYSSSSDRTQATSAMGNLDGYSGPVQLEPGDNRVLAASTDGAPDVTVNYWPRWLDEALV